MYLVVENLSVLFFIKLAILGFFFLILVFSTVNSRYVHLKRSNDWTQTANLWYWKRPHWQLSQNHSPFLVFSSFLSFDLLLWSILVFLTWTVDGDRTRVSNNDKCFRRDCSATFWKFNFVLTLPTYALNHISLSSTNLNNGSAGFELRS